MSWRPKTTESLFSMVYESRTVATEPPVFSFLPCLQTMNQACVWTSIKLGFLASASPAWTQNRIWDLPEMWVHCIATCLQSYTLRVILWFNHMYCGIHAHTYIHVVLLPCICLGFSIAILHCLIVFPWVHCFCMCVCLHYLLYFIMVFSYGVVNISQIQLSTVAFYLLHLFII